MDTVPRAAAPRALALNALAARFSAALGALAGGLLVPLVGIATCYLVIAGVYAITALVVAPLRVPQERRMEGAPPPFSRALRDAAWLIVDLPEVRTLFMAGIVCEVFAFSYNSAVPLLAQNVLATGAGGLGTLNAATSVGGAIAVVLLSLLSTRVRRQPLLATIFLLYGFLLLLLATTRDLWPAATVLLLIGFCAAFFDVLLQTLIQMAVPDEQRGRAVGVWILGLGSAPAGHLQMGMLVAALGVPTALLINGSLTVAAAAILLLRAPAYRRRLWERTERV
jgi:predicted MFS family arabinose efflux permease